MRVRADVAEVEELFVSGRRAAGSGGINIRANVKTVDFVEDGSEDAPGFRELVVADKVGLVAAENVEQERLVGVRDAEVAIARGVAEIEVAEHGTHAMAGTLDHEFEIDGLVWLDAQDEFVAGECGG